MEEVLRRQVLRLDQRQVLRQVLRLVLRLDLGQVLKCPMLLQKARITYIPEFQEQTCRHARCVTVQPSESSQHGGY